MEFKLVDRDKYILTNKTIIVIYLININNIHIVALTKEAISEIR